MIMLSVKQGGIKYHFLSLWYDLTWDWTPVSQTIGEQSTHLDNGPLFFLKDETNFVTMIFGPNMKLMFLSIIIKYFGSCFKRTSHIQFYHYQALGWGTKHSGLPFWEVWAELLTITWPLVMWHFQKWVLYLFGSRLQLERTLLFHLCFSSSTCMQIIIYKLFPYTCKNISF